MAIYSVYLYLAASEGGADVFKVSYFKGNIICLPVITHIKSKQPHDCINISYNNEFVTS